MTLAGVPRPAGRRRLGIAIGTLIPTQMIGWGTTFHVPAVLASPISEGTRVPLEFVFGGLTVMLVVAAFLAPRAGRLMERDGARRWMIIGSGLTALGLCLLSLAHGPVLFGLAWIVFGCAMPFALNQAASTMLVQISPARARQAIALMLLVTGFSSTVAWPALITLDSMIGWRGGLVCCALANLCVCLPLHAFGLPRGRVFAAGEESRPQPAAPVHEVRPVPGAFPLAALTFSVSGMLTWGLPLHMIGLLKGFGHAEAAAVSIGALIGPGQVLARGFEMAGGHRLGIMTVGVGAAILMPLALVSLLAWGVSPYGAIAFSMGYGLSAGLASIVRAVAPLRLFGPAAYATMLGRLGVPQNMAFAAAPLGFAMIRETFGARALVEVSLVLSLICLASMTELARRTRAAQAG